jgi:nucleoside-diphosphate-sugar epimerase
VLVSGATGFVGSYVARALLEQRREVAVLVRPRSDTRRIADLLPRLHPIVADLESLGGAARAIAAFAPAVTVHLAWAGVPGRDRDDPRQAANVYATTSLLDAVRAAGCRTWIGFGSQAEYGMTDLPLTEDAPTTPSTLYGMSKLCTGWLCRRICAMHGLRYVWLRLFSAYGPDDRPTWLIPHVIATLLRGECPRLTAGIQRCDYLFVEDVADAVVRLVAGPDAAGVFNVGSGEPQPVRRIVERIRDLIDPALPLTFGEIPYVPEQVMHLEADTTRLRKETGWTPRTSLDEGLRRTIAWHRATLPPRP